MEYNLQKIRKDAGYTQVEAAEATGVPVSSLRRWEQGKNEPSVDALIKLASLYNVSIDEILGTKFAPIIRNKSLLLTSTEEISLMRSFRKLDDADRLIVQRVIRALGR